MADYDCVYAYIEMYRCRSASVVFRIWKARKHRLKLNVWSMSNSTNELLSARNNGNDTISYCRNTTNDIREWETSFARIIRRVSRRGTVAEVSVETLSRIRVTGNDVYNIYALATHEFTYEFNSR